jgi:hypothetical protein
VPCATLLPPFSCRTPPNAVPIPTPHLLNLLQSIPGAHFEEEGRPSPPQLLPCLFCLLLYCRAAEACDKPDGLQLLQLLVAAERRAYHDLLRQQDLCEGCGCRAADAAKADAAAVADAGIVRALDRATCGMLLLAEGVLLAWRCAVFTDCKMLSNFDL